MFCEARSLFHPRLPVSLHPSTGTQYKEGKGLLWTSPEDKSSSGPNSGVLLLEAFCFTHTRRNLTLRGLLGSKKSLSKYRHDINTEFSFQSCHYLYSHHLCFFASYQFPFDALFLFSHLSFPSLFHSFCYQRCSESILVSLLIPTDVNKMNQLLLPKKRDRHAQCSLLALDSTK